MTSQELKQRFAEQMKAAGFQTMIQLASNIILNVPHATSFPMTRKDVTNTANAIRALVSGERKPITLAGEFSGLAQEVATLLHVAPEDLFDTDVSLDDANDYAAMMKPHLAFAGEDQDQALIVRDLQKLRERFTGDEWDILNRIYVHGETTGEIANAAGYKPSQLRATVDKINAKLRRVASNGPLDDYTDDPREYFYGADYREIVSQAATTAGGEFFRVAYRAGANPDNPALQAELAKAQVNLMQTRYVSNGIVSPYFQVKAAELMDIMGGFAYMPETPDLKMVNGFKNTLTYLSEAMPSDYKIMMRDMARQIIERLEGGNKRMPAYQTSQINDAMAIHSAMKGVDELLSYRPPLSFGSFTLR